MSDPVNLSPDEAAKAYVAGTMQPAGPQEMLDSDGQPTVVQPEGVGLALSKGYKLTTKGENDHRVALREAGEHPIEAGLEGAARGAVPFAPSILNALGDTTEGQQLRREANPMAAKAGELAGNVGQLVGVGALTGGLGDAAEAGAAGSKILDAADMAKQAAIFAGQGAQNEVNEENLGDHGYNGEAIVSQAGLGAILGAASSPAFGLAKEILPNPIALAGKAISKASDALGTAIGRGTAALRGDLAEQVGKDVVEQKAGQILDRAATGEPRAAEKIAQEDAVNLAKASDDLDEKMSDVTKRAFEELHPEQVKALSADDAAGGHTFEKTRAGTGTLKSGADQVLADMTRQNAESIARNEGAIYSPGLIQDAKAIVRKYGEELAESTDLPGDYAATRLFRKSIDPLMKYDSNIAAPEVKRTVGLIEQAIQTPARKMLSEPEVFGPKVAAANDALNGAYKEWVQANGAYYKKLGARDLLEDGRPADQMASKPSRILTFLRGNDKLSQLEAKEIFQARLQAAQKLTDVATQMARDGKGAMAPDEVNSLIESIAKGQKEGIASSGLAGGVNGGMGYSVGGFGPELIAGTLGHSTGIPGAGIAASAVTRAVRAAKNPSSSLQMLGRIKALADKHTADIAKGASKLFTGTGKVAVPEVAANSLRSGRDALTEESESEIEKQMAEVRNLTSNPELLKNTLIRATSGLVEGAQNHGMAVQVNTQDRLRVLQGALPPQPPQGMVPQKYPPSIDAVKRFQRTLKVVNHPTKAITGSLQAGQLTQDMVASADACAPKSMAQLRSAIQGEMVDRPDHEYTLGFKQGLSVLFGAPVTPDMAQEQVAFLQSTYAPPAPAPPPGGAPKPSATGLAKLAPGKAIATPSQSRQMERTA